MTVIRTTRFTVDPMGTKDGRGPTITDRLRPDARDFLVGYRLLDVAPEERAPEIAALASATPGHGGVPVDQPAEIPVVPPPSSSWLISAVMTDGGEVRLRPVVEADLEMFRRFLTEPFLIGLDWAGFKDAQQPARRFAQDGYLGEENGRLIVDVQGQTCGLVSYLQGLYSGMAKYWEIGIALLPEWRGKGIGWRAQALLSDYLFSHSPAQRVQAGTHAENVAEQKSLVKAGFQLEGVVRACEFRAGAWRDGHLYSRLRDDPAPAVTPLHTHPAV